MTEDGTDGGGPVHKVGRQAISLARKPRTTLRAWCRDAPAACLGAALVLLAGSVACLLQAVRQFDLGAALMWVTIGGGFGAGGLLLANETIGARIERGRRVPWLIAGVALIAVGAGSTWIGLTAGNGPVAAAGLVAVMVGLLPILREGDASRIPFPVVWILLGGAAMAIGPILLGQGGGRRGLGGVGLWLLGLIVFKLAILPLVDRPWTGPFADWSAPARAWVVVGAGTIGAAAGFGLFRIGAGDQRPTMLGIGLLLVIAGLSAAGLAGVRAIDHRIAGAVTFALGAAVAVAGVGEVFDVVGDWKLLITVVCAVLATFGAFFVFRGEGLVFLVLVGFVLVWALEDRNDAAPTPTVEGAGIVLALGDSFMSGEGADDFLPNTHTKSPEGNTCRRAPTAHAALVAEELELNLLNLACSGAKIRHIAEEGQKAKEDPEGRSTVPGAKAQLDNLNADQIAALDVVLLSIGGNDTGFSTIITACLLPSNCAEQQDLWLAKAESLEDDLTAVYGEVRTVVGAAVPILVVPYPTFIDTTDCDLAVSDPELAFVADFIPTLNETIARAAQRAGVHVADLTGAFEGSRLCDDVPGANFVRLAPPDGPISDRLNPAFWVDGSMHPREEGHELIRDVTHDIVVALRAEPDALVVDGTVDLDNAPPPRFGGDTTALVAEADLLLDDQRWVSDQLYATAREIIIPIALLLVGGMLLALGLRAVGFPFTRFLSPAEDRTERRSD